LHESKEDDLNKLPHVTMEFTLEELDEIIGKIRFKIYKKFLDSKRIPKTDCTVFSLCSSEGEELITTEKFSSYIKNPKEPFYLSSVEAQILKLKKNQSGEKCILDLLKVNIKKESVFDAIIGDYNKIKYESKLQIGESFKFDENQRAEMKNAIKYLLFSHKQHDIRTESDIQSLVTPILGDS